IGPGCEQVSENACIATRANPSPAGFQLKVASPRKSAILRFMTRRKNGRWKSGAPRLTTLSPYDRIIMPTNVDVPALGESVREAVLIKWHKNDGDAVAAAEPIAELETDKANVDVAAPTAGVLRRVKKEGDTVAIGDTI